jgi:hypothetical protein
LPGGPVIPKELKEISESDIDALLANTVAESRTLEYKLKLPGDTDSDKKEFLADVSAFANTSGGDLIFGIEEDKSIPTKISGLEISDRDAIILRLSSIINDGLSPRIRFDFHLVERIPKLPVLILRVERSWAGPHRVEFKSHHKFYGRTSAGKYLLDVGELRAAFTQAGSISEKIQEFRAARIFRLLDDRTPVPFVKGSKAVIHLIPLESLSGPIQYPILKYKNELQWLSPLYTASPSRRINLDGMVTFNRSISESTFYIQLFRNGVVEIVDGEILTNSYISKSKRTLDHESFEKDVPECCERLFRFQTEELGVNLPVAITLSLTDIKGLEIYNGWDLSHPYEEDHLILPEALMEDYSQPLTKVLKSLFDLIWNAFGYEKSRNFDDNGNWISRR